MTVRDFKVGGMNKLIYPNENENWKPYGDNFHILAQLRKEILNSNGQVKPEMFETFLETKFDSNKLRKFFGKFITPVSHTDFLNELRSSTLSRDMGQEVRHFIGIDCLGFPQDFLDFTNNFKVPENWYKYEDMGEIPSDEFQEYMNLIHKNKMKIY